MGAEECRDLNWVELSEKLDAKDGSAGMVDAISYSDPEADTIVNETISQIVTEDYLKVDTSDMDGVRAAVDSFYAYEKKKPARKKRQEVAPEADPEQAIRKSVDEKIIIRSEELKKKRAKSSQKDAAHKKGAVAKTSSKKSAGTSREKTAVTDDSFRHAKGLEKYRKMGILPTKKNGPSDFRKKSANWRYDGVPEAAVTDEAIEKQEDEKKFTDRLKGMSAIQWGAVAMAAVLLITSVMTTTVYADYRGQQNKAAAMSNLPSYVDDASMIAYSGDDYETEEVQMEDAAASAPDAEGKMLSLILTSVEKDLKVKLVDQDDTLVKGVKWGITVTDKDEKESSYEDDDEDGIIHLTGMSAGDYSVAITDSDSLSGYVFPTVGQKVSVKAKVEYKVIANIKDEIKKESEVNAAAEDNGNKAADVEVGTALSDTVDFVESTKFEEGVEYVEAIPDLSKTPVAATFGGRLFAAIEKIADRTKAFTGDGLASIRMVATEDTTPAPEPTDVTPEPTEGTPVPSETTPVPSENTPVPTETATPTPTPTATSTATPTPTATPTATPTPTPTPTPTATPSGKPKSDAQLYDSAKNELYVSDNGSYRLAKYGDCSEGGGSFTKFYRRVVGYVYTGWQNIDGKSYYFTKDHAKVTGDQVIGGVQYHFNSDGSLDAGSGVLGIDVSKYQPSINWSSVKASGVDFVIIRCGYRGASTGALIEDPYFKSHIKGAKSAGLKVGVYFFSTALSEAEAVEEASMCAALCSGYGLNYPVFLDVESSSRPGYNTLPASQRTANIQAFCKTIQSAGYTPGLYANKTWLTEKINTGSLSCKIWLAQYNANGPTYSGRYDIWQYTSKGHVDGISGNVDMNKSFLRY